jgi:hypothetical protein
MPQVSDPGYDPSLAQYCLLPVGWDAGWRLAKAQRGSRLVTITGIGDSIMAGQGSTDPMRDSFWALLRAGLLARDGGQLGGDHYGWSYNPGLGLATAVPPLVLAGVATTDWTTYYAGYTLGVFQAAKPNAPFVTFTAPYAVTGFEIVFLDYAAGTWTYQVDGGAAQTVTCVSAGSVVTCTVRKQVISGLAPGMHTLTINALGSTANICNILGVSSLCSGVGLAFANCSLPGYGLVTGFALHASLSDTGAFPYDKRALYQGYMGPTAAPTALTGFGFPTQPDLAIVALGVNDAGQSVTRAAFRDALLALVYSLRYGRGDGGSIVLLAPYMPDGVLSTATSVTDQDITFEAVTAYRDIKAAMLEVAQTCGCAFVDVQRMFGRTPVTNGWVTSVSDLHPTPAGHLKIANLLSSIL